MRNIIKTTTLFLFFLISKLKKRDENISVLMYHSVTDTDWKYSVKENAFKKQIEYLLKNYKLIPLYDVVDYIKGNSNIKNNSVALTFDDGYEDTYKTVFPLIRKYNIPITVFLTTNLEKKEKLGNISRLTWNQCKEMKDSGLVSFEVHGREHENLSSISSDADKLNEEILGSVEDIYKNLNYKSELIAFASGYKDARVIEFLKEKGFMAGFSISEGLVHKNDNLFSIKRIQVDGTMGFNLFKMRLTPAIDLNRRWVSGIRRLYAKRN
jgi:peptidoglycan/xylan/chitin deacetylase (PgdA/CDA1 family)